METLTEKAAVAMQRWENTVANYAREYDVDYRTAEQACSKRRYLAIRLALSRGNSQVAVAKLIGISSQRISQILIKHGNRE